VADVLQAAAALKQTQSQNMSLTDGKTRLEAVNLRRDVVLQFGGIDKHIEAVSGNVSPDILQKLRSTFSSMRAATAYHHSTWPVVSVDQAEKSYRESLNGVLKANKAFFDVIDALVESTRKA
jgi:hypothetical protein